MNKSDRAGLPNLIDRVKQLIPAKFRRDVPIVPVVRLSGVIGAVTPPVRPDAGGHRQDAGTRVRHQTRQGGGAGDQFARRLAGAIAPDLFADQAACRGKETAGAGVRRGRAASGGYMIACAGDEIFLRSVLDPRLDRRGRRQFRFQDLLKRIGVERRLYTAGEHKAMLDPFLPEDPDDVARLKALQREIHAIFIALVKERRGARLQGTEDVLFTGEYWAGEKSVSPARVLRTRSAISALDAARALWREGADARHRACKRDRWPACWAGGRRGRARWPHSTVSEDCRMT